MAGIILVYDVTDRTSFDNLKKFWLPKIANSADANIELALIGNKTDLINERQVNASEANDLLKTEECLQAQKLNNQGSGSKYQMEDLVNAYHYYEVSAKEQFN